MTTLLIVCCLSCGSGCKLLERGVAYIPGTRRIVSLNEGEPAPFDGSLLSPALLAELGPCLAQTLKDGGFGQDDDGEPRTPAAELGEPAGAVELDAPRFDFQPPVVSSRAFRMVPWPDPLFGADPARDTATDAALVDDLPDADLRAFLRDLRRRDD